MHKDSAWKETWNKFKDNSGFAQRLADLQSRYEDSDNLFVHYMKRIQDSVSTSSVPRIHLKKIIKKKNFFLSSLHLCRERAGPNRQADQAH